MPKLGMAMTEGLIAEWFKGVGDHVEKGELLLTIESDKSIREIPAEASGTLTEILANAGDEVLVGTTIGIIQED